MSSPIPPLRRSAAGLALWENFRMALATLRANKLRSGLTILGIVIGIMAVVGMTALVRGLNTSVQSLIQGAGPHILFLRKFEPALFVGGLPEELRHRKDFKVEDATAIRGLPSIRESCPLVPAFGVLTNGRRKSEPLIIIGASEAFLDVRNVQIADGRAMTREDVLHRRNVAVLAEGPVLALFPNQDPIGRKFRIGSELYTVVGTFKKFPNPFSRDPDQYVVIPYTAHQKQFGKGEIFIDSVPWSPAVKDTAIEEITQLMRVRRKVGLGKPNDFSVLTQESLLKFWNDITKGLFGVMIAISSIALMVGGIGVMNIMLVSVTERTREIGVRKAIGARRRDILWQFLIEASMLTAVGGVFGISLGVGLAWAVDLIFHFPASTPLWSVVLAFVSSTSIGLFFGIYPANRAARLDPIEALRYE
ncbi:MAG TPA: ABC transporter permease [Candidatus Polarisedimenticolia bacterium]|nr:ABC transporter permease [Candidatus Polarisedimenticolia bacterium]